jgi:hypothetical protein
MKSTSERQCVMKRSGRLDFALEVEESLCAIGFSEQWDVD